MYLVVLLFLLIKYFISDMKPTPVAEKKTSNSTQSTTKSTEIKVQKVLPVRRYRDFPIKLLLKRSFQNSRIKPHTKRLKDYNTENEREKLNEHKSDQRELLPNLEHNVNQVKNQERTDEKAITTSDINQRVSAHNHTYNTTVCAVKPNSQYHSIKSQIEESLHTQKHNSNHIQVQEMNRPQSVPDKVIHTAQSQMKNTAFAVRPKTQNKLIDSIKKNKANKTLPTYKRNSNVSKAEETTGIRINTDEFNERAYQNYAKVATSLSPSSKPNDFIDNHKKEIISTSKNYSNNYEQKTIVKSQTAVDNFNSRTAFQSSMKDTTNPLASLIALEKQYKQKEELAKWVQKYCSNLVETHERSEGAHTVADDDQRTSPPNNKEINEKHTNFELHSSPTSQSYQTHQHENQQRISVVSNDFLFRHRHRSICETVARPTGTNSRSQINSDQRNCPQLYQEALIDFMEQQYQLALRENIPLTVNRKPLNQEPLKVIPDVTLTEVINTKQITSVQDVKNTPQSKQKSNLVNQNDHVSANENIAINVINPPNSDSQSGYNILVHRGPDVNKIVITLANESEENDTNHQPFNGDQRVPDSTNNLYSDASPLDKRSCYYKEPSLRSFRRRLPQKRGQKQIRNTNKRNRFDPSDHFIDDYKNAAFAHHYSYIGNHHELPTPVLENYYNLESQHYSNAHAFCPWDLRDRLPIASERLRKRSPCTKPNIPSSQKQYHLDPHEQQILFGPLNLSLKPLTADERPHPQMYSNMKYPLSL